MTTTILSSTVDTPLGLMLMLATSTGLVKTALPGSNFSEIEYEVEKQLFGTVLEAPDELEKYGKQIQQYFSGNRQRFEIPIDRSLSHGFGQRVHGEIARVEFGQTCTYGELAHRLGKRGSARAVGQACGRNPLPVIVGCHRIVSSSGLGGFSGNIEHKQFLLNLESH